MGSPKQGKAIMETTVKCKETNASITSSVAIPTGTNRNTVYLLPTQRLEGADTPGNTLTVTITRKPSNTNDTGSYSSVVLHNVSFGMRRASNESMSRGNDFLPFS